MPISVATGNAPDPIDVTPVPLNANLGMDKSAGNDSEVMPEHPSNDDMPIDTHESKTGCVVRPVQFLKA